MGKQVYVPSPDTLEELFSEYWAHTTQWDEGGNAFRTPLFEIVWRMKGHPEAIGMSVGAAWATLETWRIRQRKQWTDWSDVMTAADAQTEFFDLWERIRFPHGSGPLALAQQRARCKPLRLSSSEFPLETYRVFLSLAWHLAQLVIDTPFYLPVHKLAPLLGVEPMTISRYRRWAVRDGFLRIVTAHTPRKKATEFVFLTERVKGMEPL